jgi:hypothetical protein
MLPTTATTPAATVGHHCSRAKNIVTRSRSRRPSRQSFLADAPIARARPPNTMKQARAPATLGKVTSNPPYEGASPAAVVRTGRPRAVPRLPQPQPKPRNGRATISTAMLATPGELATPRRDRSWSSDPAQKRPATLTRTDCTAMTVAVRPVPSAGSRRARASATECSVRRPPAARRRPGARPSAPRSRRLAASGIAHLEPTPAVIPPFGTPRSLLEPYERGSTEPSRSTVSASAFCARASRRRSTRGPTRRMTVHTTTERAPAKAT